jgi:hypothetical protein
MTAPSTYYQLIQKPVSGTVTIPGATGTLDYTTGIFTKSSGTPTTWTGQFDIPVRFAEDYPHIGLDSTGAYYAWTQIKLRETRDFATFIESPVLPREVSAWATGGRGFKTTVVETYGGNEYRNAAWSQALGEWDITEALRSTNPGNAYAVYLLRNFLMVCRGQLYGFRFRDPQDYKDEGGGVLVNTTGSLYQMYKGYAV